ncbi:hypothetical protein Taro_007215 [Colocasia esculenta]|uniref:Uncharacterized protein n=1 Tax=Colocasia esculenta TaxID=4460 RepID=A0A843U392_COLES|nr:hypothetical protein [Colocasia esculenta]
MSGKYTEEERNGVSKAKDVDVQIRLCCSDLQALEVLDTTRCDTPLCGQSTMLLAPDMGNKSTIFKGPGILTRTRCRLGDDGSKQAKDSPKGFMERIESLHRRSRSDDLTPLNFNRSSPSNDAMHEEPAASTSPPECNGFDKIDIWVSSLDLDKEDSQWDDLKDGSDGLGPDFPSPSYRIIKNNLRVRTSKLSLCPSFKRLLDVQPAAMGSPSSLLELSLKRAVGVDSPRRSTPRADEPLFWPFDWKSYWRPELDGNYLGISPRAGIFRIKRPRGRHAPKHLGFGLQQHKRINNNSSPPSLHKENMQQGYRKSRFSAPSLHYKEKMLQGYRRSRFLISSSRSEKPTPATKKTRAINTQAVLPHASRVPSRLSRSSTSRSSEKSAGSGSKKKGKDRHGRQLGSGKKKRGRDQNSTMIQYLLEFEAAGTDHFQVYLGGEIPIEALVGLDEFDGQEGVGKMMRSGQLKVEIN